jgi:hypothetical protein
MNECEQAVDTRWCATHQRPWRAFFQGCDKSPRTPLDDAPYGPGELQRMTAEMRVKGGKER